MKRLIRGEKGASIILVALAMVALLGFAALAIDAGNLYYRHTRLQDIADSCALAAAHQLGEAKGTYDSRQDEAFVKAHAYAIKNGLTANTSDTGAHTAKLFYGSGEEPLTMVVVFRDGINEVQVDLDVDSDMYFGRVLGFNRTPVSVDAIARLVKAGSYTGNYVPLCFFWPDYETGVEYPLTLGPGDGNSGNYGYVDYKPTSNFDEYLEWNYTGELKVGQQIDTYPGASVGQVNQAIGARLLRCPHIPECTADSYVEDCPRVVIIPTSTDITADWAKGKSEPITITGFIRFFITGYDKNSKILKGVCLGTVVPTTDPSGYAPDYMVQTARLTD